jgi:uncharacterized membrane protein/nitrite reductase/ring-hydroxylating ferredoxin subunit
MLKDILQGKPFRHPLHPFLVHFPIGLFVLSLILDLAAWVWPEASGLSQGAFYCIVAGLATALLAAVPGFADYSDIRRDHPARKIALAHMLLNLLAVGLYAVNAGLRWHPQNTGSASLLPLLLSITAVGILSLSGHLGGKLVFDDGISVGRHRRKTRTPQATLRAEPGEDRFVKIAKESALAEGETLRVQLNGVIIAIAKNNGNVFAFQEFCTHRFGPLSEGCMKNGEIECPWHRSRFDMRTGTVTHGPAKENLKAFEVIVRDGEIFVSREVRSEPAV